MKTKLRETRELSGESMSALALRAGLEPATLSLIERGKRPSKKTAKKLASALHCAPETLFENYTDLRDW